MVIMNEVEFIHKMEKWTATTNAKIVRYNCRWPNTLPLRDINETIIENDEM